MNMNMNLQENFTAYIKQQDLFQPKDRLLLAVSGGVDSVVLCELCYRAGFDFAVAHCNFQLREADSKRDETFVKDLAKKYGAAFYLATFDTTAIAQSQKKSIEEAARDLRYAWFKTICDENNYRYILTAHHANDNIETVLMNFFRGTGIKGLHGILPKQQQIVRPLLFANKNELGLFAAENMLEFVTDHTNAQNEFTRNYFRNELIPSVKKIFPGAEENILKNISRFGEAEQLYNQAVDLHKKKLLQQKGNEIHIPVLKLLKTVPLPSIVYEIIKEYNFAAAQTDEVIALLKSESGKYIKSTTHRILKNRNWLIISFNETITEQNTVIESGDNKVIYKNGELLVEQLNNTDLSHSSLVAQLDIAVIKFPLLLRKWKTGDYFYPLGMQKKKKLSRFLIDQKLSLSQKEKTWVIEMNKKIIWVVGMRIDDRFKVTAQTKNILRISSVQK
jgi:tRNA(Ile)-lysidine synthase